MSDWLYPLSRKSGCFFADDEGNKLTDDQGNELGDTSFGSFKKMMRSSVSDDWWYLSTNFRNVHTGDRVWIYYGVADGDVGITGLATICGYRRLKKDQWPDIHLRWNRRATSRLIATPVPAKEVRKFIPRPRAPVWNLDRHPKLVDQLVKASGI